MWLDHFIPRNSGGDNSISNLLPACKRCNTMKGIATLERFRYLYMTRELGIPAFSPEQIVYLRQRGIDIEEEVKEYGPIFQFELLGL